MAFRIILPAFLLTALCCLSAAAQVGLRQEGGASYYANYFHGHRTASGAIYSKHKLTAAHRTLPFGTMVRVTNPDNQREVVVEINDRGPFHGRRIIDLSLAAAAEIDMLRQGHCRVAVEIIGENGAVIDSKRSEPADSVATLDPARINPVTNMPFTQPAPPPAEEPTSTIEEPLRKKKATPIRGFFVRRGYTNSTERRFDWLAGEYNLAPTPTPATPSA